MWYNIDTYLANHTYTHIHKYTYLTNRSVATFNELWINMQRVSGNYVNDKNSQSQLYMVILVYLFQSTYLIISLSYTIKLLINNS